MIRLQKDHGRQELYSRGSLIESGLSLEVFLITSRMCRSTNQSHCVSANKKTRLTHICSHLQSAQCMIRELCANLDLSAVPSRRIKIKKPHRDYVQKLGLHGSYRHDDASDDSASTNYSAHDDRVFIMINAPLVHYDSCLAICTQW